MTVLSSPGRMPAPVFIVHFLSTCYWGNRREPDFKVYTDEAHMKRALSRIKGQHGMDAIQRIELIAAAPIDVTGSYTK